MGKVVTLRIVSNIILYYVIKIEELDTSLIKNNDNKIVYYVVQKSKMLIYKYKYQNYFYIFLVF